jgi:outer membrane protein TolC
MITAIVIALPTLGSENDYETINLASLESRILKYNLEIKRAIENVSISQYREDEAIDNQYDDGSSDIETDKNSNYYIVEAEMNLYYYIWTQEETEEEKVLEGTEKYFTYQFLEEEIELQNQKIKRLESDLETVNVKIGIGKAILTDRTSIELSIQEETYNLQKLINDKEKLLLDLNVLMNYDLDTDLVFESTEIPFEEYTTDSIDDQIEYVIDNDGELAKLKYELRLAGIEIEVYEDNNDDEDYDYEITELRQEKTNYTYDIEDKIINLEYEVRSQYNDLLNAYDSFAIKDLEIDNLEIALNTIEKRYEVGLESKESVIIAKEDLEFSKLELSKAKLDYYLEVESYKNFVE